MSDGLLRTLRSYVSGSISHLSTDHLLYHSQRCDVPEPFQATLILRPLGGGYGSRHFSDAVHGHRSV